MTKFMFFISIYFILFLPFLLLTTNKNLYYIKKIRNSIKNIDVLTNQSKNRYIDYNDTKNKLEYIAILENDYICKIDVENSIMMDKIIDNMILNNNIYYTELIINNKQNNYTQLICSFPKTWFQVFFTNLYELIFISVLSLILLVIINILFS